MANPDYYVFCHDEVGVGDLIGPFPSPANARDWIAQHNNDLPDDVPGDSPLWEDLDHYCLNIQTLAGDFSDQHMIIRVGPTHTPKFDERRAVV